MTFVMSWDLFEDIRSAQEDLLRLTGQRAQSPSRLGRFYDGGAKAAWMPTLDISERKDGYLVAVDLPGVSIDDVEITFQDGLLTIQGERHGAHDSSEDKVHRVERRFGPFLRSITLPSHIEADAIEASAKDGVLQILMPKAAEAHAKRIQVQAGQKPAEPVPAIEGETSN